MKEKTDEQRQLEAEFYAKKFYLSYSGLSKLITAPSLFYKYYVLNQKEELTSENIIKGQVIHCLLLDRDKFDEKFVVASSNTPSENTKLVVDKVFEKNKQYLLETPPHEGSTIGVLDDFGKDVLDILKEVNLHQTLKTDQQRLDKIITTQTIEYFNYLRTSTGKLIVDLELFDKCVIAVECLKANEQISKLLNLSYNPEIEVFNEQPLQIDNYNKHTFGIHGALDNVTLDHANKVININDLKTTGKILADFEKSVEQYNYWLQAAMYIKLVRENFKEYLNAGWKMTVNFVVIDKFNQTYAFPVSGETLVKWETMADEKLMEAQWHLTNNSYDLPYKFATGKVIL